MKSRNPIRTARSFNSRRLLLVLAMIAVIATLIAQTSSCPLTDSLYKRSGEHRFGVLRRVVWHACTSAVKEKKRLEPSSMCRR